MESADRQALRDAALAALAGTRSRVADAQRESWPGALDWQLQTSNSFRRIGTSYGDGDVLCGTKHPRDGHPDLLAHPAVLDFIVAAQPRAAVQLLDHVDALERTLLFTLGALTELADVDHPAAVKLRALVDQLAATLAQVGQ